MRRLTTSTTSSAIPFPTPHCRRVISIWPARCARCTNAGSSPSASWNGRSSRSPGTCAAWRSCSTIWPSTRLLPSTCWTASRAIRCAQARLHARAGVDMLKIGDDMGTQIAMFISPAMYRRWFKPRHAAVIRAAREIRPDLPVCYHSDGKCWDIIPDLIEIGVNGPQPRATRVPGSRPGEAALRRPAGLLGRHRHPNHDALCQTRLRSTAPCSKLSRCWDLPAIFPAPRTSWNPKCPGTTSTPSSARLRNTVSNPVQKAPAIFSALPMREW